MLVGIEGPGPVGRERRPTSRSDPRKPVEHGSVLDAARCFTHAPARSADSRPTLLSRIRWRARRPLPRKAAAVDRRAGTDDDVVVDDEFVVGQQMQHRVLEDLDPGADPDRAAAIR